jgi:hypothetical protein
MRRLVWVILIAAVCAAAAPAGDAPQAAKGGHQGKSAMAEPPPFTPERETAALEFVGRHHAELGELLARLKELKRDEYESAIRELFQTRERLAAIRAGDEPLHALMLEVWQVESQIKVFAARHAVAARPDPKLEQEIKDLLYKQVDLQRKIIEHNRDKSLKTLEAMNANIKLLSEKREEFVERRLQNLIRISPKAAKNATP